jgi:hypothetical protein
MQVGTVEPVALVLRACMQEFPNATSAPLPAVQQLVGEMRKWVSISCSCSRESANPQRPAIEVEVFFACMRHGLVSLLKPILDLGTWDPACENQRPIRMASQLGCIEGFALLIADERVVPTNEEIITASEHGHAEIVQLLLNDPRLDPSAFDNTALQFASACGRAEVVDILLRDPRVKLSWEIIDGVEGRPSARPVTPANVKVMRSLLGNKNMPCWPSTLGRQVLCHRGGLLRRELDATEAESSFYLLLCVKRRFSACVAARVSDVLQDVCAKWTPYSTCYIPVGRVQL